MLQVDRKILSYTCFIISSYRRHTVHVRVRTSLRYVIYTCRNTYVNRTVASNRIRCGTNVVHVARPTVHYMYLHVVE